MPPKPKPPTALQSELVRVYFTPGELADLRKRHGDGRFDVAHRLRALALRDIGTVILSHDERLLRDGGDVTIREALTLVGKARKGEEDK